jgi:hypothetical protein
MDILPDPPATIAWPPPITSRPARHLFRAVCCCEASVHSTTEQGMNDWADRHRETPGVHIIVRGK